MRTTDQDHLNCIIFLNTTIGTRHSIAVGGMDLGKDEFQVMPDDFEDQDFFDWYCETYPDDQFFVNIYECVVRYAIIKKWYDGGNRTIFGTKVI